MFKKHQLVLQKKKRVLSEYKVIVTAQDLLPLFYQAIQKNTPKIAKIPTRMFTVLQINGPKSHRYVKRH